MINNLKMNNFDSDSSSETDSKKQQQQLKWVQEEQLKWENRKEEIRPRIQYKGKEEIFVRKVEENLTNFFKINPELEIVKILDLTIIHSKKNTRYGDSKDEFSIYINDILCTILKSLENSNVRHIDLTSDWEIKEPIAINASDFAWRLYSFTEENKTLELIVMTGIKFDKETEERLRHFMISSKSQLRILTDFSDDPDIIAKRASRLALNPNPVIPFVGVFGTNVRIRLSGDEILEKELDGKLILILNVKENTYDKSLEYSYAIEGYGGNNCNTIRTVNGEVSNMSVSLGGFYQIRKEGDIFVCEIQNHGGYKSPSVFNRIAILTNFFFIW